MSCVMNSAYHRFSFVDSAVRAADHCQPVCQLAPDGTRTGQRTIVACQRPWGPSLLSRGYSGSGFGGRAHRWKRGGSAPDGRTMAEPDNRRAPRPQGPAAGAFSRPPWSTRAERPCQGQPWPDAALSRSGRGCWVATAKGLAQQWGSFPATGCSSASRPDPAGVVLALAVVAAGGCVVFIEPGANSDELRSRAALTGATLVAAESEVYAAGPDTSAALSDPGNRRPADSGDTRYPVAARGPLAAGSTERERYRSPPCARRAEVRTTSRSRASGRPGSRGRRLVHCGHVGWPEGGGAHQGFARIGSVRARRLAPDR